VINLVSNAHRDSDAFNCEDSYFRVYSSFLLFQELDSVEGKISFFGLNVVVAYGNW
jgi:hypothetical protein